MSLFDPYNLNSIYSTTPNPNLRSMVPNPPQINPIGSSRDIEKVNGIESAKQYQMPPNSRVALFDANDDIFYIKQTDASGFPLIRKFRFVEEVEEPLKLPIEENKYLTVEEFNKFKEELLNGEQFIRFESGTTEPTAPAKSKPKKHDADVQSSK